MIQLKNIFVALVSIVLFSSITNAQALKTGYSVNGEEPLTVKYIGEDGKYLLFKVTLQSKNSANDLFAIDDKNEGELYSAALENNLKVQTIKNRKKIRPGIELQIVFRF